MPYAEGKQFKGYVNGVEIDQTGSYLMILIPMMILTSSTFLITKNELEKINDTLGPDNL